MVQPVMDTLQLSEGLREAGMEPDQADGVARALGAGLDEHVAVRKDVDLGLAGVHGEMALMRTEFEGSIERLGKDVRGEMALMRTELEGSIEGVRGEMALMRTDLEGSIEGLGKDVRGEMALMRANLEGRIDALESRFNLAFGMILAVLSVIVGIGLIDLNRSMAAVPATTPPPVTQSVTPRPEVAPAPVLQGGPPAEAGSLPP